MADDKAMNNLALIQGILRQARTDGTIERVNDYLVSLARKMGMDEATIRDLCDSDELLVIYAP